MSKRKSNKKLNNKLLPFNVIMKASNGDIDAINAVVNHYENYITILSSRELFDKAGNSYLCVDNGLRQRLRTKLITAILNFRTA